MLKAQEQHDSEQQLTTSMTTPTSNKYSEPPELLKSNRTTASSFLHNSNSQSQFQAELEALELTVKQHQQELLGEKALLGMRESLSLGGGSATGTDASTVRQSGFPLQQQQLQNSYSTQNLASSDYYRVETLSESSSERVPESHLPLQQTSSGNPPSAKITSSQQTLAVATLPRCNGSIGSAVNLTGGPSLSSFMSSNAQSSHNGSGANKPHPPPRGLLGSSVSVPVTHYSTLPHHPLHHGSLRREKRIDYGDNSDSNNETDELKV